MTKNDLFTMCEEIFGALEESKGQGIDHETLFNYVNGPRSRTLFHTALQEVREQGYVFTLLREQTLRYFLTEKYHEQLKTKEREHSCTHWENI